MNTGFKSFATILAVLVLCQLPTVVLAQRPSSKPSPVIKTPIKSDCSPSATEIRKTAIALRASNSNDDYFFSALDVAILGEGGKVNTTSGSVGIASSDDGLSVFFASTYATYRFLLKEALRKKNPIAGVPILGGVLIVVAPSQIDSQDIVKVVVERDGQVVEPTLNTLKPTAMTTRMGAKFVVHAGSLLYQCSAFASGAVVKVTLIPSTGDNFETTPSPSRLALLK